MPSAFMQRRESSYITLGKYVYAVLIRASSRQFCMYQRCSQLRCLSESNEYTHTLQVKQKAPIQHHNVFGNNNNKK